MSKEPTNSEEFEYNERTPVKKKSLYNISIDYNELMSEIELQEGVLTDDLVNQLEINKTELQSKSIAYLEVIKTKEVTNTLIDNEIKRLQAMKKVNNNITARLKENLLGAVNLFGSFEVGLNKFGIRKSSAIQVDDVNSLPDEYKTRKLTETANKTELKNALKRGEVIKGVELVENINLKIN